MNFNFKNLLPHLAMAFLFLVLASLYFLPELSGNKIGSHDAVSAVGAAKESMNYYEKTGEIVLWTNSVFSGIPLFQINYPIVANIFKYVEKYQAMLPVSIGQLFSLMLFFYIAMLILKMNQKASAIGAIMFGLCTWFLLSIEASHVSKIYAIAYVAPVLASFAMLMRQGKLIHGLLFSMFLSLQIGANHLQITYYTGFALIVIFVFALISDIKSSQIGLTIKHATFALLFSVLGVLPNTAMLWTTYDFSKETIRGGQSELTVKEGSGNSAHVKGGLDKDYAMSYSYGMGESFNLLIPNFMGGGMRMELKESSATYKALLPLVQGNTAQAQQIIKEVPTYWGGLEITTGPTYLGAIAIFLFIMSLFFKDNKWRWPILGVALFGLIMSWGKNFSLTSDLFFDYIPMWNKFRAPSMILFLTAFAVITGAVMSLNQIFATEFDKEKVMKALKWSVISVGGAAAFFLVMGSAFFDFTSNVDTQLRSSGYPVDAIIEDRISMMRNDAMRSLFFILLAAGIIWTFVNGKLKNASYAMIALATLAIADVWLVDKRYVNNDDMQKAKNLSDLIVKSPADNVILQDTDPYYRVFNTTVSSFNDVNTSFYHHSVGGYSAAKLIRYQELIERHLSKGNPKVFDMLNTKYFINKNKDNSVQAIQNPNALGNAWPVKEIIWAKNADEEMELLGTFSPDSQVVIDARFKKDLEGYSYQEGSGMIKLNTYHPDKLVFVSNFEKETMVVFSDIFYKGNQDWISSIDGKETDHIRVNYVLRGMRIPAGERQITFEFKPVAHYTGLKISYASSALVLLTLIGLSIVELRKKKAE